MFVRSIKSPSTSSVYGLSIVGASHSCFGVMSTHALFGAPPPLPVEVGIITSKALHTRREHEDMTNEISYPSVADVVGVGSAEIVWLLKHNCSLHCVHLVCTINISKQELS